VDGSLFGPRGDAVSNVGGNDYSAMFSGPADLALERKMQKKQEEDKSK
jgi:hypothetical protein